MGEDTIVVQEEEAVDQVCSFGLCLKEPFFLLVLTVLIAGRGRGSTEFSGPFPNFLNAAIDQSHLISTYGSALVSDSLNPIGR